METSTTNNPQNRSFGVHGVRLKHFEQVVASILPTVQPDYVILPPAPVVVNNKNNNNWPFDKLPKSARVLGDCKGQLKDPIRAARKEGQLRSMLRCILKLLPESARSASSSGGSSSSSSSSDGVDASNNNNSRPPFHICDFGGGSGHLGIPLALLLPHCRIVVVDLQRKSLELMHQKADQVAKECQKERPKNNTDDPSEPTPSSAFPNDPRFRNCQGPLTNLYSFFGPVEDYTESFDMALALHLCGEATDVTLRRAVQVQAAAMVVAPCCVGKLSKKVLNPSIYHATGSNIPTVQYPQSSTFCQLVQKQDDWDALVKAADYSDVEEFRTTRNATRRTAKALLETDRRLFLQQHGYQTALMRMDPWEVTPKNDIVCVWRDGQFDFLPDVECQADVKHATNHLLSPPNQDGNNDPVDAVDWSGEEEQETRKTIQDFLDRTCDLEDKMEQVFMFPTKMGGRRRKLIHFVAGQLNLAHWSEGSKDREKTVAVARRGRRKRDQSKLSTSL